MPNHRAKKAQRCESPTITDSSIEPPSTVPLLLAPFALERQVGAVRYTTPQRQILHELKTTSSPPLVTAGLSSSKTANKLTSDSSQLFSNLPFEEEKRFNGLFTPALEHQNITSSVGEVKHVEENSNTTASDDHSFSSVPQWSYHTQSQSTSQSQGFGMVLKNNNGCSAATTPPNFGRSGGSGLTTTSPFVVPSVSSATSNFQNFRLPSQVNMDTTSGAKPFSRTVGRGVSSVLNKRCRREENECDAETQPLNSDEDASQSDEEKERGLHVSSTLSRRDKNDSEGIEPHQQQLTNQTADVETLKFSTFCRVVDKPFSNVNPLYLMLKDQQRRQESTSPSPSKIPIRTFYQNQKHYDPLRKAPRKSKSRSVVRADDCEGLEHIGNPTALQFGEGDVEVEGFHDTPSQFLGDRCDNEDSIMAYFTPTTGTQSPQRGLSVSTMCAPSERDRSTSPPNGSFAYLAATSFPSSFGTHSQNQPTQHHNALRSAFLAPPPLPPPTRERDGYSSTRQPETDSALGNQCSPTPKVHLFEHSTATSSPLTGMLLLSTPVTKAESSEWIGNGTSLNDVPTSFGAFGTIRSSRSMMQIERSPLASSSHHHPIFTQPFPQNDNTRFAASSGVGSSPLASTSNFVHSSASLSAAFASPKPSSVSASTAQSTRAAFSPFGNATRPSTSLRRCISNHYPTLSRNGSSNAISPLASSLKTTQKPSTGFHSAFPSPMALTESSPSRDATIRSSNTERSSLLGGSLHRRLDFTANEEDEDDNSRTPIIAVAEKKSAVCQSPGGQWQAKQAQYFRSIDQKQLNTVREDE